MFASPSVRPSTHLSSHSVKNVATHVPGQLPPGPQRPLGAFTPEERAVHL